MEGIKFICSIAFFVLSLGSFVTGYTYFRSKDGELRVIMYRKFWCCAFAFFCVGLVVIMQPFGMWMVLITVPFVPYGYMKLKLFNYINRE